ncbi:hypothetical protein D3C87_1143980 [compost metagenome]
MDRQKLEHPRRIVRWAAAPARAQDGAFGRNDLGLHKEISERRMQFIRHGRRDDDLGIAGDFYGPPFEAPVRQVAAPQLDIVFRRHDDFGVRVDLIVGAAEFGPSLGEDDFVVVRPRQGRLVRRGPDGAAVLVLQVAERAPVVAGTVFAPAGHGQVSPTARARAAVGDHDVIASVGQELHLGNGAVGGIQHAHRRLWLSRRGAADDRQFHGLGVGRRGARDPLLQQEQGGLEGRIGFKARLHRASQQHACDR